MTDRSNLPWLTFDCYDTLVNYSESKAQRLAELIRAKGGDAAVKKGYVGIHSTGFRDFLLKPELLRAIVDCGFEHPSEGARGVRPADVRPGRSRRLLAHFLNFGAQFDAATKPAAHAGGPTRILPRRDRECPIASKRLSRGGDIESAGGISLSPAVPRR